MKDKKYEEALELISKESQDTFCVFLKSHILLAMKKPKEAIENLISANNNGLLQNEGYVVFLLRAAVSQKISYEFVRDNLLNQIDTNTASEFTLLHLSEYYTTLAKMVDAEKVL